MLELQQRNEGGEFGVDLFWFGLKINDILLLGLNWESKNALVPKKSDTFCLFVLPRANRAKSEKEKFSRAIIVS